MAIDFYSIHDSGGKKRLLFIEQKDFDLIQSAITELEKKTGLTIDQYGTSRIGDSHIKIVTAAIQQELSAHSPADIDTRKRLEEILSKLSGTSEGFLIIGD